MYHKARAHHNLDVKKAVKTFSSDNGKSTRRNRSRSWTLVKYRRREANDSIWGRHHCHHQASISRKRKVGIENMFVDKDTVLPHNHEIPAGSGKIVAVGKVEVFQAHHQQDGKARSSFSSSPQNGRPVHSRQWTWNATRLRETESVMLNEFFTIWAGGVFLRIHVVRSHSDTNSFSPQHILGQWIQTGRWSDTVVRPCHWTKPLVPFPQCTTAHSHLHLSLISDSHTKDIWLFS